MKSSMFSTFQALAWAEQQSYGNPLEKLMMLRIASASAREGSEQNTWFVPVEFADYAAYCFADAQTCADALEELERRGLLIIGCRGRDGAEIALPWWIPEHQETLIEDLAAYGQNFRDMARKCQNDRCWYCGNPFGDQTPHLEHQVPRALGGRNNIANLVLACAPCNLSKGARTVTEFRAFRAASARCEGFRFWGESRQ